MVLKSDTWSMEGFSHGDFSLFEHILGLVVSIAVLIAETIVLVLNIDRIRITSIIDLFSNFMLLSIYVSYICSIILIPAIASWSIDLTKEFINIYRLYIVRSLKFSSTRFFYKGIHITLLLTSVSFGMIIIGVMTGYIYLSLLSLLPFSLLIILFVKPFMDIHMHEKSIERELRWFLVLLLVIEGIGSNIGFLIARLKRAPILPAITQELRVIDRDSKLYYISHIDAIIHRSDITPNKKFAKILAGYSSKLRSGGDIYTWLKTKLEEEMMYGELSLKMFIERILSILGQLAMAIYVILPLISLSVAIFVNIQLIVLIAIISTPMLIAISYSLRPKMPIAIDSKTPIYSFIALSITSLALYRFIGVYSIVIGWLLAIALSFKFYLKIREYDTLDTDSIEILRNIIELRRAGLTIPRALEYIVNSKIVRKVTAERIRYIVKLVENGHNIIDIVCGEKAPFLFKFTLFTLGLIHESGGGSIDVFQELYEYVNRSKVFEDNVRKMATFFDIFALANTFIIIWVWNNIYPLYSIFTFLPLDAIHLLVIVSTMCYAIVSTVIRRALPIFEPRSIAFLLLSIVSISLIRV